MSAEDKPFFTPEDFKDITAATLEEVRFFDMGRSLANVANQKVAPLLEALRFYADEKNYDYFGTPGKAIIGNVSPDLAEYDFVADYGYRARKALGEDD